MKQPGYGPFGEVEFDNGRWEIEVFRKDEKRELHVNPRTGEFLKDERDSTASTAFFRSAAPACAAAS